ncbi:hypothetical protein DFJ73DRAFT_774788 [Zopfochytrium polystomum]|nr:hypothetical protein DFJ73DRAFT_774788 [Zopfochytrium polystomum]
MDAIAAQGIPVALAGAAPPPPPSLPPAPACCNRPAPDVAVPSVNVGCTHRPAAAAATSAAPPSLMSPHPSW